MAFLDKFCALSVLLKVRKTFTSEFSSVLFLGSPCPGRCREVSPGFRTSKEWMLQNIYSSDVFFSHGHSSGVIPVVLSLEAGRDFLYFAVLVMVFPRCVWGMNTGQGRASQNWVAGRSESRHGGRAGFPLFALTQECSRCDAGICQWWLSQSQACLVPSVPAWKWGRAGLVSKSFARHLSCAMGGVVPFAAVQPSFGTAFLGIQVGHTPRFTLSCRTRSHLGVGIN